MKDYSLESTGKINMAEGRYTEQGRNTCENLQSDCEPEGQKIMCWCDQ